MGIVAYKFFTPLFFNFTFRSTGGGGGAWPHCVLFSYANDIGVAPGFFNGGPKPGSIATERGEGVESMEILDILCMKISFFFFLHIK